MVEMTDRVKVTSRISPELDNDLDDIRERLGLNKSAVITLCIAAGLTYIKAMINPESLITSRKMAEVMEISQEKGVKFYEPEPKD